MACGGMLITLVSGNKLYQGNYIGTNLKPCLGGPNSKYWVVGDSHSISLGKLVKRSAGKSVFMQIRKLLKVIASC